MESIDAGLKMLCYHKASQAAIFMYFAKKSADSQGFGGAQSIKNYLKRSFKKIKFRKYIKMLLDHKIIISFGKLCSIHSALLFGMIEALKKSIKFQMKI